MKPGHAKATFAHATMDPNHVADRVAEASLDLSEWWRTLWQVSGYVLFFAICGFCFYLTYRLQRRWLRVGMAALGILLAGIGGLALWFDLTFVCGSRMRGPAIPSPDGRHVAVVYWIMSGAVGFDHVHVAVRSRYSPLTTEVFAGLAQDPPNDPTVTWTDGSHLQISYSEKGTAKPCDPGTNRVRTIEVMCQE